MRRKQKVSSISFDENSRREFITGFHKRKLERRKKFTEKLEQKLKDAKKQIKIKAREMTKKIVNLPIEEDTTLPGIQKYYELPEHTVKIRELFINDTVQKNSRTGENESGSSSESESKDDADQTGQFEFEDSVPGMQLNSIKSIRKIVCKQSAALMKQDSAFRKMNKITRAKNKQAAKKKSSIEKHKKRRKRRR